MSYGQAAPGDFATQRLAVFLDCGPCDETFVRQEMTYVDYVTERESADVHVLVTGEGTGGGGEAITLDLIGRGPFEGIDFTRTFATAASATEDQERQEFLRALQLALVPYLVQTPTGRRMALQVDAADESAVEQTEDPWNGWTIEFYGDAFGDMESSRYSFDARYGVFVDRVTPTWKIRLRPYFNYNFDRFERDEETITSESRRDGFDSYAIRSIDEHWSIGLFGDVFSSTYSNIDLRLTARPGLEYSLFPYREATRKQLTVAYLVGGSHVQYDDSTIFGKLRETLAVHSLNARYEVTQPWGEVDAGVEASQYLYDLTKYSVEVDGGFDVRLTQALSIDFGARVELVHDQINLPKGDASLEEVLLQRRQLATSFELSGSVGFRYRIGSIYNNVVNTRF